MNFSSYNHTYYLYILKGFTVLFSMNNHTSIPKIYPACQMNMSKNTSLGIVTGYKLDDFGLIPGRGKKFFSAPQHPDRL